MFILFIINGLIFGFGTKYIANEKGKNENGWFWLGFWLGIIGLLIAIGSKDESKNPVTTPSFKNEKKKSIVISDTNVFYHDDCPVLLNSYELKKYNDNTISIHCDFENIGLKTINAVIIDINSFSIDDKELNIVEDYSYLDLRTLQYNNFGKDNKIQVADNRARKFTFIIKKILFEDKTWWINKTMEPLIKFKFDIHSIDSLGDLTEQYQRTLREITSTAELHKNLIHETNDFIVCGCGKLVTSQEEKCPNCGAEFSRLREIKNHEYLNAQLEKARQDTLAKKDEQRKNRIILSIVTSIFAIVLIVTIKFIMPQIK